MIPGFGPPQLRGEDLDKKSGEDLLIAAQNGDRAGIEAELAEKVDINYEDNLGHTALWWAADTGNNNLAKFIIQNGGKPNNPEGCGSPLHVAALHGSLDVVDTLLKAGSDVNAQALGGKTPVMLAIQYGFTDVTHKLVGAGADLHIVNHSDVSTLHFACAAGDRIMVNFLLDHGVSINGRNQNGKSALHIAAEKNNIPVIKELLNRGIDTTLQNGWGQVAAELAGGKTAYRLISNHQPGQIYQIDFSDSD